MAGTEPGTASDPRSAAGSDVVSVRSRSALVSTAVLVTEYEWIVVVVSRRTRVRPREGHAKANTPPPCRAGYGGGGRCPVGVSVAAVMFVVIDFPPTVRPGT